MQNKPFIHQTTSTRATPTRPLALRLATSPAHWLARHPEGSHLVNFPFVFAAFLFWMSGLIAAGCGVLFPSVGLSVMGFLLMLAGAGLYGGSPEDE